MKTKKVSNPAGKSRKGDNPYASWTDPRTGWKYRLLKSWQGDNSGSFSRWFVEVFGYGHNMGDEYVKNLINGVFHADDLVFDESVWGTRKEFLEWVSPR